MRTVKHASVIALMLLAFLLGQFTIILTEDPAPEKHSPNKDAEEARKIAECYIESCAYSKEGLKDALVTYEYFSKDTADAAVDSMSVDWQEQAEREVEAYLNVDGISEKKLREHMERDLFTQKQTDKAIAKVDPDWKAEAERRADVLRKAGVQEISLRSTLALSGFRKEEIDAALN